MISKFYVKNYKSIRDRVDVSLVSTKLKDDTQYQNTFNKGKLTLSKLCAFYGANATGKSNILSALLTLRDLIVSPINNKDLYHPFLLDEDMIDEPTEFGITFSPDDSIESYIYSYEIKYNRECILEEKFEKRTSQKASLIYKRRTTDYGEIIIEFGNNALNKNELEFHKKTLDVDVTFLSRFGMFKVPDLSDAYRFFGEKIVGSNKALDFNKFNAIDWANNPKLKEFTLNLLKASDLNIVGIKLKKALNSTKNQNNSDFKMYLEHGGKKGIYQLSFDDESQGTKKLILLSKTLFSVFNEASIFIMDEIENSFHPEIAKLIVICFLDEDINPKNSQILFSSHDIAMLDLGFLRRDQIIFTYKDKDVNNTYIHYLSEYSGIRKTDCIYKDFMGDSFDTSPNVRHWLALGGLHDTIKS